MSFGFKIEGLDEAIKTLEDLQNELSYDNVDYWCKRISNGVKLQSSIDDEKDFKFKLISYEDGRFNIDLSIPAPLIDITVDTISKYLPEMGIISSAFFAHVVTVIKDEATTDV